MRSDSYSRTVFSNLDYMIFFMSGNLVQILMTFYALGIEGGVLVYNTKVINFIILCVFSDFLSRFKCEFITL
jgi:hypothetical protein